MAGQLPDRQSGSNCLWHTGRTYRTGGSIEAITDQTGFIVPQGNVKEMLEAARLISQRGKAYYQQPCRTYALENFRKEDRYQDYLDLYDKLTERNPSANI